MVNRGNTFLRELSATLLDGAVATDPDITAGYRYDEALWTDPGHPQAVAFPVTTADVQAVLRTAHRHGVPVVPRGAGSGLSGGAAAVEDCVVLCLDRMDAIRELDVDDRSVVVEPGVINADISGAVAEHGLWYPPDPASKGFSTIGGNIATNAGGLCCVKYGVTRDYVLGLEVILADGTLVETGRRTVKGVAGLDLTGLFVGSEGTLGVVTSARLRLRPLPRPAATSVAFFPTLQAAGRAVADIFRAGVVPSLAELLDQATVRAVEDWRRMGLDVDTGALLLLSSDAPGEQRRIELELMAETCDAAGASYVAHTEDPTESDQLLMARRLAYPALERLGATLLDDVAVPRGRVPDLLARIGSISDRHDVLIGTFGHAGDGNMHPTIVMETDDEDERTRARQAFDDILTITLELGGTITGEHGVGTLKNAYLERELSPGALEVNRSVKTALDPTGILNPGKALGI
ncbi:MAG: FAD-binding protein [Actinobacteria bacterium]|nr:FAD-binding protein [Actinomycetota bacterium]